MQSPRAVVDPSRPENGECIAIKFEVGSTAIAESTASFFRMKVRARWTGSVKKFDPNSPVFRYGDTGPRRSNPDGVAFTTKIARQSQGE